jgi:hypothetical protein
MIASVFGQQLSLSIEGLASERRIAQRHRLFIFPSIMAAASTVEFGICHGGSIDCRVRNLSTTGVCLEVASPVGIPADFILSIGNDHEQHPCQVAWRSTTRIGVAFK